MKELTENPRKMTRLWQKCMYLYSLSLISCSVKSGEEVISEYISTWVEDDWIIYEGMV